MSRHYFDHASTTPTRPEAIEAMLPWLTANRADPGRVHTEGRMVRAALEDAREQVATLFGARPREVVFTSGGTEAVNTAVWGATARGGQAHVVCPAVEHSAARDSSARHDVSWVGVDGLGRVDPDELLAAVVRGRTALVHLQWANHEVGTIQPVAEVVARCREAGVLVHVDAVAAAGHVAIDFDALGADFLSVSAHKLGGPPGAGALLVRRGLRLQPLLVGGEQERARRAGFENVPAYVGFGAACAVLASDDRLAVEAAAARAHSQRILSLVADLDDVSVFGDPVGRVPHIVCVGVEGVEAEGVLLGLDQAGIAAHSGSSCSSESLEPSPVLAAMGVAAERSLRLSVGWTTTDADLDALATALPAVIARLRALRAAL